LGLLTQINCGYCQINKSDLRLRVESIIKDEIKYVIDSTTNQLTEMKWDSTKYKGIHPSFNSLPPNPMTILILEGKKIELKELDNYKMSQIEDLHVYPKNDPIAMALYGTSAKSGLIIIELK